MLKRLCTAIVLCAALCFFAVPCLAAGETSGSCGDGVFWTLDGAGTLTISGSGPMEDYGYYDEVPWRDSLQRITSAVIGEGVTTVGGYALGNCTNLKSVVLSSTVKSIGCCTFANCTALGAIILPAGLEVIGDRSFIGCTGLTSVLIPDSVTLIDAFAFCECKNLASVSFGTGVKRIGHSAFEYCYALQAAVLPDGLVEIEGAAFRYCTAMTELYMPPSVETLGRSAFGCCEKLRDFTLSSGLKTIDRDAFASCNTLTSVVIPDSVTFIGNQAYAFCESLKSVVIGTGVKDTGVGVFSSCQKLENAVINAPLTYINKNMFGECTSLSSVNIPQTVEKLWGSAFYACKLKQIEIPRACTSIDSFALNCIGLEAVYFDGDAPDHFDSFAAEKASPKLTLYYTKAASGWTSPTWNGYKTALWDGPTQASEPGNPFVDVPAKAYYHDAVLWALENGVTTGTSDTTFSPYGSCTRAQAVTFLWRAVGEPEPENAGNPFVDVREGDYFYKAVLWAVEKGITTGTAYTTFSPGLSCSYAHVVTFLWRAVGEPAASGESTYTQNFSDRWYAAAAAWADSAGLLEGVGDEFVSEKESPRGAIVTYLYRSADNLKK